MDSNQLVLLFIFCVLTFLITSYNSDGRLNDTATHSRRKRFVVFPDGSTYSVSNLRNISSKIFNISNSLLFTKWKFRLS